MDQQKVTQAVEAICNTGCTSVNAMILTLESGMSSKGFEDFNESELIALTNELKAIMSVYEGREK